jgi:hypothetical protein
MRIQFDKPPKILLPATMLDHVASADPLAVYQIERIRLSAFKSKDGEEPLIHIEFFGDDGWSPLLTLREHNFAKMLMVFCRMAEFLSQ